MIGNNQYSEHLGLKKRCLRFNDEEKFDHNHGRKHLIAKTRPIKGSQHELHKAKSCHEHEALYV